jgi:hypothetical protein
MPPIINPVPDLNTEVQDCKFVRPAAERVPSSPYSSILR